MKYTPIILTLSFISRQMQNRNWMAFITIEKWEVGYVVMADVHLKEQQSYTVRNIYFKILNWIPMAKLIL